ncbi:hypothetical protein GRI72_09415 [Altererythrobacter marinus]|uniref:Uncharacterized protein n=1 Tax=Pelagerythrobacter marinus TaxID=538382 RepID=A0ABW9UYU9_9SPHN|nr:hypothetical protein [Pelagerythrobacter marinus]MXO69042.1 hypothetical protein [Pelagerythrobacter marinus]
MTGSKPLTPDEKAQAFRRATSGFEKRFAEQISRGMSDAELAAALKECLGIFGGSGGPHCIDVSYQGAGLKIWAARSCPNHVLEKPVFEGSATIEMARHIYEIRDPADTQMLLF